MSSNNMLVVNYFDYVLLFYYSVLGTSLWCRCVIVPSTAALYNTTVQFCTTRSDSAAADDESGVSYSHHNSHSHITSVVSHQFSYLITILRIPYSPIVSALRL